MGRRPTPSERREIGWFVRWKIGSKAREYVRTKQAQDRGFAESEIGSHKKIYWLEQLWSNF